MSANCRFAMAVHVLAVLAYKQGDAVSSTVLASSVNTNPVIVRRLLLSLQAAKLVETRRGPGLGSRLSRPAAQINLAEVYRAVETEEPFAFPRKLPNRACPIGQGIRAVLERVGEQAEQAVQKGLAQITLASIVEGIRATRGLVLDQPDKAPGGVAGRRSPRRRGQ